MNKKNVFISAVLSVALAFTFCSPVKNTFANTDVMTTTTKTAPSIPSVRANGYLVAFPDALPYIDENNRTLMPLRFVSEQLGAKVSWNNDTRTAMIVRNGIEVDVPIESDSLTVKTSGNTSTVKMDTKAVFKDGRTFVPIRFVANALDCYVGYSDIYDTVLISNGASIDNPADITLPQTLTYGTMTASEIARLQSYYDMDCREDAKAHGSYDILISKGYKMLPDADLMKNYNGTNGFANAVESIYRDSKLNYLRSEDYMDRVITKTMLSPSWSTDEEYARGYMANAACALEQALCYEPNTSPDKVVVSMKTDPSLVFHSKCDDDGRVRGVITLTIASDCDMDSLYTYAKKIGLDGYENLKAGQSYTFDGEIRLTYFHNTLQCFECDNLEKRAVDMSDKDYVG